MSTISQFKKVTLLQPHRQGLTKKMHWFASLWLALRGDLRATESRIPFSSHSYHLLTLEGIPKLSRAISGIAFGSLIPCNLEGAASRSDSISHSLGQTKSQKATPPQGIEND